MSAGLNFVAAIAQRATVIVVVAVAVLAIAGVPHSRGRYRTLAIILTLLSALAACEWYVRFVIDSYLTEQTIWVDLAALVLFVVLTLIGAIESIALLWFKRRMNSQAKSPTGLHGLPRAN